MTDVNMRIITVNEWSLIIEWGLVISVIAAIFILCNKLFCPHFVNLDVDSSPCGLWFAFETVAEDTNRLRSCSLIFSSQSNKRARCLCEVLHTPQRSCVWNLSVLLFRLFDGNKKKQKDVSATCGKSHTASDEFLIQVKTIGNLSAIYRAGKVKDMKISMWYPVACP